MAHKQTFIRVLGERNTGTRALIEMMRAQPNVRLFPHNERGPSDLPKFKNLKERIERYIKGPWKPVYLDVLRDMEFAESCPTKMWKHGRLQRDPAFITKESHLVFLVRDPYSWIVSLARNPYHLRGNMPETLGDFLMRPWKTMGRDNMDPVLPSPLTLWNVKNGAYLEYMNHKDVPAQVIRFEDFVADPVGQATQILQGFSVPFKQVERLESSTKDGRTADEIADFHAREGWTGWLTADVVEEINRQVDWKVASAFGYEKRNPARFPEHLDKTAESEMRTAIGHMGKTRSKSSSRSRSWMSRLGYR